MTHKKEKLNVAMVGYYNTLPFLYGLEDSSKFNLILDIPSRCMGYYDAGEADIALVPATTLLGRSDYKLVTDYCIGCVGAVRTVCLFTNSDLSKVTKIYLDQDSRTSQLLTKLLCERLWNIEPTFEECNARNINRDDLKANEAILMIGDKVFEKEESYRHCYDLGSEWQKMTGLPFAFAVWIARLDADSSSIAELNHAIGEGANNIDAVLRKNQGLASRIDLLEYFEKYIDFSFDDDKKLAFNQFMEYANSLKEVGEDMKV